MRSIGIVSVALLTVSAAAKAVDRTWYFETDNTGQIAKDFSNEVGDWKVVATRRRRRSRTGRCRPGRNHN